MADSSKPTILEAEKYAKIEISQGAVAALTQLAADLGAPAPDVDQPFEGSRFRAHISGVGISGDGLTKTVITRSAMTAEAAAASLLKALLNPQTASGDGDPYLVVYGNEKRQYKVVQPAALLALTV